MNQHQKKRVLDWLESGKPLSSMEATKKMQITRLAAVVHELKKQGFKIESERKYKYDNTGRLTSWWVEYRMVVA